MGASGVLLSVAEMNLVLVGWLVLCLESASATQCLSCAPMPSTVPCVTTKTCPSGQECFANYVLKTDGTVMYEFGCKDTQTCPGQIGTALIDKRASGDTELCYKCCHGDMCNQGNLCTGHFSPAVVPTTVSTTTSPVNPCSPSPCMRGACYIGNGNNPTFFCLCPRDFTGKHCETVITTTTAPTTPIQTKPTTFPTTPANPCSPSPCVRGSCYIGSGNNPTFFCLCPTSFTGKHCETIITTTTTTPIQTTTTATTTGQTISTVQVQSTTSDCVDVLPTCNLLDKDKYCVGDYLQTAYVNCRKYCGLCNAIITTSTRTPITTPASYPFELLLKGVAGAPGPDIYQLWHSQQTLNTDKPLASHLTTEYNGHYKPDTSNNWQKKCFDQIRVSIYNGGVEKAYILFNATGSTKDNWFTTDRIIDSTWTDLKTATKEIMSLSGDANTGREFYISGHTSPGDSCDSFGWMMVSTKASCFYEAGDAKPTFYYAPGTNLANWAMNNPLTGDLFVIQGRPTCNSGNTSGQVIINTPVPTPSTCDYKGQHYTQGQTWTYGCLLNCSCVDATTGYYRCFDLCPRYTALPPGCSVEKKPGECCGQPICNITDGSTMTPSIHVGGTSFCLYKGQYYVQDQTWNDGCSQSCTCTNAPRGMYSCRAVCMNWDTLPSICHLEDPAAGLCCQQPRCPNGVIIDVPQTYKDEYPGYNYV